MRDVVGGHVRIWSSFEYLATRPEGLYRAAVGVPKLGGMSKTLTIVLTCFLAAAGCVPPKTAAETQAERKAEYEAANQERERYAADRSARGREADVSRRAALEDQDRQRVQTRQASYEERIKKNAAVEEADCASDRPERMQEVKRRDESLAHVNELIQWEIDHCKSVDSSKPVTRFVQDGRGEYHTVAGRDRGVDRVCDAKLPAEIAKGPAGSLPVYRIPKAVEKRIDHCASWDEKAAPTP
jgi:hypothetical protein